MRRSNASLEYRRGRLAPEPLLRKIEHIEFEGHAGGYSEFVRTLTFLAALCALLVAGCRGGSDDEVAAPPTPPPVTEPAAPDDTAKRPTAPPIEGITLDGERAALADLRGQQVFVNVWSSW